ncbi:hypothetical protein NUACC21_22070 [Scytonema sp. NUACC21]
MPADAEQVVRSRALDLQCPVIVPQPACQVAPGWAEWEMSQHLRIIKFPLVLQGQIQLANTALALGAVEILQTRGWKISEEAIVNGMAKTKWLGRIQWTTWRNHKLLLDGAHNPGGAQALRDYVDTLETQRVDWIMGMLARKDHEDIFKALLRSGDRLFLVPVPDSTSADLNELAAMAWNVCPELSFCATYPDVSSALETSFGSSTGQVVVLCGSLYLIGHFFKESMVNGRSG